MRNSILMLISICLILTTGLNLFAEIINVPDDFEEIQAAIEDDGTEDGDTVLVAPGTYGRIDFSGKNIVVASYVLTTGDEAYIDSTVIDGNEEEGTCVLIANGEEDAELVGFSVTRGYEGGIFCSRSSSRLKYLKVFNNRERLGGGIHTGGCNTELQHVKIYENYGGGLYCSGGSIDIRNSTIYENETDWGYPDDRVAYGGGAHLQDCIVSMDSVDVINNLGNQMRGSGGLYCADCEVYLRAVRFRRNSGGGKVAWFDSGNSVSMESVDFCDNDGRISIGSDEITMKNTTISWNYGLIEIASGGELTILNSIIYWYDEEDGDGIYLRGGSTLRMSYSDFQGGQEAIAVRDSANIIWGESNIDEDPLFVDPDNGDFHLTEDSPCIDAGDPDSPLDPDSTRADMGAYYYPQEADVVADLILQPSEFNLYPAYPNPFNSTTTITYGLDKSAPTRVAIYDLTGREIVTLVNGNKEAGYYNVVWDADVPSGIYICKMDAGGFARARKLVLVR